MNRPTGSFAVFAVAFMGFMDFVPLYAVYALLFQAEGLSESGISLLLAIWSVTGLVAEVPSGALADLMSRRLLLSVGSLLTGLGFASWLVVPTFIGFATGFVLWGLGGAVASGTWESLVYDELAQRGATDRYAGIIGAGESAGWIAAVASAALTTPLLAAGGYELVGWVSVSVMVLHSGLALTLPTPRGPVWIRRRRRPTSAWRKWPPTTSRSTVQSTTTPQCCGPVRGEWLTTHPSARR